MEGPNRPGLPAELSGIDGTVTQEAGRETVSPAWWTHPRHMRGDSLGEPW